ncbi:MAG: ABC transporter ATP-binding protein [Thermoguttaceae bacterium]
MNNEIMNNEIIKQLGTPDVLLQVENVSVQFDTLAVLRQITFSVHRGETVAIIGESGCGKTVLLKTLIALNKVSTGRILFDQHDLNDLSYYDMTKVRTRFGFVFQQAALFDSMTIGENIAFPLNQHSEKSREEISEIVKQLLQQVGLSDSVLDKKPAELSGGMRKRVGFARSLALDPEIVLYDEPTTGLDPIMSDVINELIIKAHTEYNVTGIMVTHDMKSACKVADRIIMLYPLSRLDENAPQMIFDGTPDELRRCSDKRVWQFLHGIAHLS